MSGRERAQQAGVALAAGGAVAYGITVVVGRDLAEAGIAPAAALGWRFTTGGVLLLAFLALRGAPLHPAGREWPKVFLLGAIGYATESTFFYLSLERGTAAATALIFYSYPAIVAVIELVRGNERPDRVIAVALALSVGGAGVVAAAGGDVAISGAGIVFALLAAATFSAYLLVGRELGRRTDAMTTACWVALGAGIANLTRGAVFSSASAPSGRSLEIVVYGAATAIAFTLMFAAIERIGASRAAVVMTLEAFSAVVLGAVLLGEELHPVQLIGGVAVLGAAAIIGARGAARAPIDDLAEAPP